MITHHMTHRLGARKQRDKEELHKMHAFKEIKRMSGIEWAS